MNGVVDRVLVAASDSREERLPRPVEIEVVADIRKDAGYAHRDRPLEPRGLDVGGLAQALRVQERGERERGEYEDDPAGSGCARPAHQKRK